MGFGALGSNMRAVGGPIGTAGAGYDDRSGGAGVKGTGRATKYVPLSQFFLDMSGSSTGDGEDGKTLKGKTRKREDPAKTDDDGDPYVPASYKDKDTDNRTTAAQSKLPPRKKKLKGPEQAQESAKSVEREHMALYKKPRTCRWCDQPATKSMIWADGRAFIPTCDAHEAKTRNQIEKKNDDEVAEVIPIAKVEDTMTANVAAYPKPIGGGEVLRRTPQDPRKKKRLDRLMALMKM